MGGVWVAVQDKKLDMKNISSCRKSRVEQGDDTLETCKTESCVWFLIVVGHCCLHKTIVGGVILYV